MTLCQINLLQYRIAIECSRKNTALSKGNTSKLIIDLQCTKYHHTYCDHILSCSLTDIILLCEKMLRTLLQGVILLVTFSLEPWDSWGLGWDLLHSHVGYQWRKCSESEQQPDIVQGLWWKRYQTYHPISTTWSLYKKHEMITNLWCQG